MGQIYQISNEEFPIMSAPELSTTAKWHLVDIHGDEEGAQRGYETFRTLYLQAGYAAGREMIPEGEMRALYYFVSLRYRKNINEFFEQPESPEESFEPFMPATRRINFNRNER